MFRYIGDATGAIYSILKEGSQLHANKKKRLEIKDEDAEFLQKVSSHVVTKEILSEKLAQHVEQVRSFPYVSLNDRKPALIFS